MNLNQSNKIKVLFRHRSMEMGGVEKVLLSILNNLDQEKFDFTVCLNINQGELKDEFPSFVRKVSLTKGKEEMFKNDFFQKIELIVRRFKLLCFQKYPAIVDKYILSDNYDIEVAMSYQDYNMVLNSTNKKSKKIAWFHSEIQLPKLQPIVPKILNQFPQFDSIIYCSERIKELMHKFYPNLIYPEEKVIINAIPISEIKEKSNKVLDYEMNGPVFFSMARLHTRKGFHKLIDVHARLVKEGYLHSVLILGEGEEEFNLRNQIKDLNVENSFIIKSFELNPYPYLKQSDFYILPSESEAWPLVIAEALILQKPIIATNVGDVRFMINHGKTGHLINYDTDEIYEGMKKFLVDKDYVSNIKENLLTIEKQFDNELIFKEIESTFLDLLNK